MEKMTNRKALEYVKANCVLPEDVAEKIDGMICSLDKKSASKKPTKTQVENEKIKETIVAVLAETGNLTTVSELCIDPRVGVTNQKATALLRQLVEEKRVRRTEEKGKAYYAVGEPAPATENEDDEE